MDFQALKNHVLTSPAFVLDEDELIGSLKTLDSLRRRCGVKVLYSIKSLPLDVVLKIAKPYIDGFSVSSLFEARLADEILAGAGGIHLTTPGIRPDEFNEISRRCTHISFNSLSQYQRYAEMIKAQVSIGIRVNPKLSFLNDDRFDPCRSYSKLGADIDLLFQCPELAGIKGLHVHNIFSATDFTPLLKTMEKIKASLEDKMPHLEWLNLGGGYLFNRIDDHRPFIDLVRKLRKDFAVEVYIEPGKAVVGRAGHLFSTVIDCFESDGKDIAILDTSVNHNPEVFEYQRRPELFEHSPDGSYSVILAGSTCLAGDIFGEYRFDQPLAVGDKVIFYHIGAYSLVKASRFNGYNLPDIYSVNSGRLRKSKRYPYEDFRRQWQADE
jgi:carboxynorspermidine decarboxylase